MLGTNNIDGISMSKGMALALKIIVKLMFDVVLQSPHEKLVSGFLVTC